MPCKVLIVDDNAEVRRSLRAYLEQNPNVTVCGEAENGEIAIERVNELSPDAVILDWQMPIMNGLDAARHIAQIAPTTTMALFTMHAGNGIHKSAEAVGIHRVFSKSDQLAHLVSWLSSVCAAR